MATLTINRATRRTLTIRQWLGRKNKTFSSLCGEVFTNQQVLLSHLYCIALIALCCVAEWLEGGIIVGLSINWLISPIFFIIY